MEGIDVTPKRCHNRDVHELHFWNDDASERNYVKTFDLIDGESAWSCDFVYALGPRRVCMGRTKPKKRGT